MQELSLDVSLGLDASPSFVLCILIGCEREGEIVLCRKEPPNWLSNSKWSVLKSYHISNFMRTEQIAFKCLCICIIYMSQ